MKAVDIVFLIINVVLAIISGFGAYKSNTYFKKSKHITIYAQTSQSYNELGEMLKKLPDALAAVSSKDKKGFSVKNTIRDIGTELSNHLNTIMETIPSEYSNEFRNLQKTTTFELSKYINSLIDGTAIVEESGSTTLKRSAFDTCQERLREMQEYLKKKIVEEEEKLK